MKYWDGKESMPFEYNDGGRTSAGFKSKAGDCVCRAIVVAAGLSYRETYDRLARGNATQRRSKHTKSRRKTASHGISVRRKWFKDYMRSLGFEWIPTMKVGQGCKVHLLKGELPNGNLVVQLSGHYTAVIDGVIHDSYDPTRCTLVMDAKGKRLAHRCVYGYWRLNK